MLPNLIVIGAAKAGTTSLHYYLALHPDIAPARQKELHFFSNPKKWAQGVAWYESNFDLRAAFLLESSPSYTSYPQFPHVPERMHALVPDARLIYIVRDPIERAVSNYYFAHHDGREPLSLADALTRPNNRYVSQSKYWMQLERYLAYYDASRILILSQDDLSREGKGTLQQAYRFLGLDDPPDDPAYALRLNESRNQSRRSPLRRQINKLQVVQRIPLSVRLRVGQALFGGSSKPTAPRQPLDARLRQHLVEQISDDAARFREFTGRRFEQWTI